MLVHQGLKAQDLKVAELKYWLSCRGAPTKKADLVAMYKFMTADNPGYTAGVSIR